MKVNKCCFLLLLIILGFSFIPTIKQEKKEGNIWEMKHYRYKDLEITSGKKPFNTHLWWEHATYGLVLVDADDQTKLYISTDKADNWVEIDLTGATTKKIQAGWVDTNDLWLVTCDNPDNEFTVIYIELDNSNNVVDVGDSAGEDAGTAYVFDIFKINGTMHVLEHYEDFNLNPLEDRLVVWDVDGAPAEVDNIASGAGPPDMDVAYGVVVGDIGYFLAHSTGSSLVRFILFNEDTSSISVTASTQGGYLLPAGSMRGPAYDGIDTIIIPINKIADGKNYLLNYGITGDDYAVGGEYDVALQLDRNNAGIVPNELEKGFEVNGLITYEIKPRRGGIVQLQDLSHQVTGKHIIAITDNFVMFEDDP